MVCCFIAEDLHPHALHRSRCIVSRSGSGFVSTSYRTTAAALHNEQLAPRLGLLQFLLKLVVICPHQLSLRLLILDLLRKTGRQLAMREAAIECDTRQIILPFGDRQLSLAMPAFRRFVMFLLLLLKKVLVGNSNCHLRLYL